MVLKSADHLQSSAIAHMREPGKPMAGVQLRVSERAAGRCLDIPAVHPRRCEWDSKTALSEVGLAEG